MKIRKNQIKNKCLSEKYYSSIKYMSHTLKGNERVEFIKTVCDINIYLGCLCATTCEANKEIDNYIWNVLNNYFKPQKVKYYDSYTKEWKVTEKRRRSFDITNYLLVSFSKLIDAPFFRLNAAF